jgi:Ser/Thr protein kinase RdoA (MazF antagonist)
MKPEIKALFNKDMLAEVAARYGVRPDQMHELDGFESFIYAFAHEGRDFILRIGHSHRRSEALVLGEVDWLNYLARGGAGVARAEASITGRLVESFSDGAAGHFLATAFVKAAGRPPWENDQWQPALFEQLGRLIGRIHALSKDYIVSDPAWTRPHWDDPVMLGLDSWLPPGDTAILRRFEELMSHIQNLPRNRQSYGLIHQDAHAANFFVDEQGRITLFDFDDCTYSWYINDVAIALFYAVTNVAEPENVGRTFWTRFRRGYEAENTLDPAWLEQVPHFLKLREIDLYAAIHRSFDVDNLTNPWVSQFMAGRRERISNGVPYLDLDLRS